MKNVANSKIRFTPVTILKQGVLYLDGNMVYTDAYGKWLYVSEDGQTVIMFNNATDLIRDIYKKSDNEDYVITGWDFYPTRFTYLIDDAYNYYNARFEE